MHLKMEMPFFQDFSLLGCGKLQTKVPEKYFLMFMKSAFNSQIFT